MSKFAGILAVVGTSAFGALAVLGAIAFRDGGEVPKWSPPSASYAPMMAGFAEPAVAPRAVAAPIQPAPAALPKPLAVAPPPVPAPLPVAPMAALPAPPPLAIAPPPVAPQPDLEDMDDDELQKAQEADKRRVLEANKLRALDMRNKRMVQQRPRFVPRGTEE